MSYQSLEVERRDQGAWVWMNRARTHNAFDEIMIAELTDAFAKLDADETVRVVVLAGRGKSFSAGANLNWMERAAACTEQENLRDARAMAGMLKTIDRLSKPTVARVHGTALGGGVGLVVVCDIAIASSSAGFATTEVRYGLNPSTISPYLVAAIGGRTARRYLLTAERFSAEEACRTGLVHEVCAPEEIDDRVNRLVHALVAAAPKAQAEAKGLIRDVVGKVIDDGLIDYTAKAIARLRATPEAGEGIRAFIEKRKPAWDK
jgi:methylglutaconyl-CoA hydratase